MSLGIIDNQENIRADEINVIEFKRIIGTHKEKKNICTALFIKELSNGSFISSGTEGKMFVYNENFKKIDEIDSFKEWTYSICERKNFKGKSDTKIQFIGCSNKEMYLIDLAFDENKDKAYSKTQKFELPGATCKNCIEMKIGENSESEYVILGLNGGGYYTNLFVGEGKSVKNKQITEKTYRGAIRITDNIVIISSNRVGIKGEKKYSINEDKDGNNGENKNGINEENEGINGEDALILYNYEKMEAKKIVSYDPTGNEDQKDYSFIYNNNGLALISCDPNNNENTNKTLLCACKKYFSDQKNGILLVDPIIEDKKEAVIDFYDTGDFEVYCFCPLFEFDKNTVSVKHIGKDLEYFLVGGFDNDKCEGKIKLYKIFSKEKEKIEFLQDIEIQRNEIFRGFKGAISSIIQSTKNGNILASCYDGNIYLLSIPNLDFYLQENETKQKS